MLQRRKKPDALQGTLDLLVLKTLSRGPEHGYGIAARIQTISNDVLRVEEGSLRSSWLRRLRNTISGSRISEEFDEEARSFRSGSSHGLGCNPT
jgi:hypothetical protein